MGAVVDILAEEGWSRLNADRLASRARAGKAGIYRRWPDMSTLARDSITRLVLVEVPPDTGSLRGDLLALMKPWLRQLDRAERATASVLGAAFHDARLQAALDEVLVAPLAAAVREITHREDQRGLRLEKVQVELLGMVLQALWLQRLLGDGPGLTHQELHELVDGVVLPVSY